MRGRPLTLKAVQKFAPDIIKIKSGKKRKFLLACPVRSYGCTAHKPRWVFPSALDLQRELGKPFGVCRNCTQFRGGYIDKNGYHMTTIQGRDVAVHRLIMEKILGRKLRRGETVHHKNGKRADNHESNLELRMAGNHPKGWSLRQMREYLKTVPKKLGGLK
jgi:HNH endonuclease